MGTATVIAVDWSGAKQAPAQRRAIWMTVVQHGRVVESAGGRTRDEVVDALLRASAPLVAGLDFSFAAPEWQRARAPELEAGNYRCSHERDATVAASVMWHHRRRTAATARERRRDDPFRRRHLGPRKPICYGLIRELSSSL
jgi:hypothetical protein